MKRAPIAAGLLAPMVALTSMLIVSQATAAERPAALVEDMSGDIAGVELMDYVAKGKTISLASGQTLVLSYLYSCVNETITGGEVTVGVRESTVTGGKVKRATPPCDGGNLLLSAAESGKAGVTVMRDAGIALPGDKMKPQITLYKTHPVVVTSKPGMVTFERVDRSGPTITVKVTGKMVDMSKGRDKLARGGLYRVSDGATTYLVKVADDASDKGGMAVGRFIRF